MKNVKKILIASYIMQIKSMRFTSKVIMIQRYWHKQLLI